VSELICRQVVPSCDTTYLADIADCQEHGLNIYQLISDESKSAEVVGISRN